MAKRKHRKNHNKNVVLTVHFGELANAERQKQQGGVIAEVVDRDLCGRVYQKRHRAAAECALDAYRIRGYLSEAEYEAGLRFRRAYLRAVMGVVVCDNLNPGCRGDAETAFLIKLESERLLTEAYASLLPKQRPVIIAVCGHDEFAGGTRRIQILRAGLESIARQWRLI